MTRPATPSSVSTGSRSVVGYLCASRPDGPLIPPASFTDPCGHDKAVYSDGTIEDLDSRGG